MKKFQEMNLITKNILVAVILFGCSAAATAQAPGSQTIYGGPLSTVNIKSGTITSEFSESLIIGPGNYVINGVWKVYAKNILIDPSARLSGTGTIELYNPAAVGGSDSRTLLDGNASGFPVDINVRLYNDKGLELENMDFPAALASAGFSDDTAASWYIGKDLSLATNGANIWLDSVETGDLRFTDDATISDYNVNRMIITNNSIVSHVVRDAGGSGFFFPVGIAPMDYTPVHLAGANTYHVSVIDYSASVPQIDNPAKGMNRTWHIFGGAADTVTLYHNSPATDGAQYLDADAFITRYLGSGQWSSGSAEQVAAGAHSNAFMIASGIPLSGDANGVWLTKSSSPDSPLPVTLLSFDATKDGHTSLLTWETSGEQNVAGFEVEHSMDSKNWTASGYVESLSEGHISHVELDYQFVDTKPETGRNFYRLKMIDLNGGYRFSEIRSVLFESDRKIVVYPNPFSGIINIEGLEGNEDIQVFDAVGRMVYRKRADGSKQQINLEQLSDGSYQIRIVTRSGLQSTFKVKKIK